MRGRFLTTLALLIFGIGCHSPRPVAPDAGGPHVPPAGQCVVLQPAAAMPCRVQDDSSVLPRNLAQASSVAWGKYVYVAGGMVNQNGDQASNSVYVAPLGENGAVGSFVETTPLRLPAGIAAAALAAENGFLYLV